MGTTVGRLYRFRATHSLPDFPPPWRFPHEHDYTIEVEAPGGTPTDILDKMDFSVYEGEDLNAIFESTTVEALADAFLAEIPEATAVTVWEDRQRWGRAEA